DVRRLDEAEARMRVSAIRPQLVAALDTWIPLRGEEQARRQLADLANRLSEPDEFRREVRQALVALDDSRVLQLAKRNPSAFPSSGVLLHLAFRSSSLQQFEKAVD